jgi:hypothetical protein
MPGVSSPAWLVAFLLVLLTIGLPSVVLAQGADADLGFWHQVTRGLAEHLGALLIAAFASALAWIELRGIRLAAEARATSESDRLKAELEAERSKALLERDRFASEEKDRKARQEFLDHEADLFRPDATLIAKQVGEILVRDPTWARNALDAAKLGPYSGGAFGERSHHFELEKNELAQQFVKYLFKRCEVLAKEGEVYLMIDAGTTLYPLFGAIGKESRRQYESKHDWINHLHLTTNNLPGLEHLISTGRCGPGRHSPLAIRDCHLLPGVPMPVFGAVGGPDTEEAIERFRCDAERRVPGGKHRFIALVVGNWVRIRRSDPKCPIPMARGEGGKHHGAKNRFIKCADEVYVISPLGKIFVASEEDVNRAMELEDQSANPEPDDEAYKDVDVTPEKAPHVKLVTTSREAGKLLHDHSVAVRSALGLLPGGGLPSALAFANAQPGQVPHLVFPFGPNVGGTYEAMRTEFPHPRTRTPAVLKLFQVEK